MFPLKWKHQYSYVLGNIHINKDCEQKFIIISIIVFVDWKIWLKSKESNS